MCVNVFKASLLRHNLHTIKCTLLVSSSMSFANEYSQDLEHWDFPGGSVVKNPPANAGDTGSIPGPERSHMPWSN